MTGGLLLIFIYLFIIRMQRSVFILTPEIKEGETPENGVPYYKMRIGSIRMKGGEYWVVGTWFYSRDDLAGIPRLVQM